ncbi:hypothetical protein AaE_015412 [Aphanomyces astaci]|uniref:Leucine-rich repeat-containing N-terminal plant-type domain-containing protein n=1 Tax=Aphanomyces astaci TaxID=112090 RepID=A0A6A4YZP1_APHAT|nr:hypothetical protein AaE_015412 [Aphanomyces astaci]
MSKRSIFVLDMWHAMTSAWLVVACVSGATLGPCARNSSVMETIHSQSTLCLTYEGNNEAVMVDPTNSSIWNFSAMHIDVVDALPVTADIVYVGMRGYALTNALPMSTFNASIRNLSAPFIRFGHGITCTCCRNLSYNNINTTTSLAIPENVTVLDLSFNFLEGCSWLAPPLQLTSLYLRGNNLRRIALDTSTLPPLLVFLDLRDNPHLLLTLDNSTLARVTGANFTLRLPNAQLTSTSTYCANGTRPVVVHNTMMCVMNESNSNSLTSTKNYTPMYMLVAVCTVFFALVAIRFSHCSAYDDLPLEQRMATPASNSMVLP